MQKAPARQCKGLEMSTYGKTADFPNYGLDPLGWGWRFLVLYLIWGLLCFLLCLFKEPYYFLIFLFHTTISITKYLNELGISYFFTLAFYMRLRYFLLSWNIFKLSLACFLDFFLFFRHFHPDFLIKRFLI